MSVPDRSMEVLEASYRLDLSDLDWLREVARTARDARPVGDMGMGAAGFFFEAAAAGGGLRAWDHVLLDVPEEVMGALSGFHASLSPEAVQAMFLQPAVFATLTQMGVPADPRAKALGIPEVLGLQATDSSGAGCALLFTLPRETVLRKDTRTRWEGVALHLRAALRLRRNLAGADPFARAEAIIDPSKSGGRVVHAAGPAQARSARDTLREIACSIDRARTSGERQDGQAVHKVWPMLVEGQWTLVEQFDSDGRRYYVALRNEPAAEPLIRLTPRERDVLAHAVQGISSKAIANDLALTEATVNTYLRRAKGKLGVRKRAHLTGLDSEVEALCMTVGESKLMVMRTQEDTGVCLEGFGLSGVEKAVALGIWGGLSNQEIADKLNKEVPTVANQIQSIFRKARVSSRYELCRILTRRA